MSEVTVQGTEHWTRKGDVRLFLWRKSAVEPRDAKGTILFVHGSSMASQPTFDLHVPGRPDSSAMDWFARARLRHLVHGQRGLRTLGQAAPDQLRHRERRRRPRGGQRIHHAARRGASKAPGRTASRRARCEPRCSRSAIRSASRASRSTPSSGPARAARRWPSGARSCPSFKSKHRRPIDRAFVHSIFDRDHPGTADEATIDAFADAILALDDSVPTGTYVDMCSKLPLVDPAKITVPTIIMRGEFDGIAGFDDLIEFFKRLPNPDKQFTVMAGISHASFQQKNYLIVYHILHAFFTQPEPVYRA